MTSLSDTAHAGAGATVRKIARHSAEITLRFIIAYS
jgi:hypothetical protein